ncbi:MAG: response regulator [Lachnospiraceae bacterium]|nr:response regulator [Lachnospiraceae bacterium]
MKNNKLGVIINMICSFIVIIIYLIIINTASDLMESQIVFLNLFLAIACVVLIVSALSSDINPRIPKLVIVLLYAALCVVSLFVNGSNYMLFQLMMLSLGAISLLMSRNSFHLMMALNTLLALVLWVIPIPGVDYAFSNRDYALNLLILASEYVILYIVLSAIHRREMLQIESNQTVEELIKVIGAKREAAMDASRAKSDFLANMSHEIRTPINAILGFNEMILRENSDANVNEFALDIRSSGNSLLALINDILDFSKIEAGKMEILPVTYDLGTMLNDMINVIGFRASEKGLSLKFDVDPSVPHVLYGDEVRIKQVITNILTNAVKYTQEGYVDMTVGFEQIDDYQIMLKVSVTDTGQGIKEEDIDKLYQPFERVDGVKNRNIEGTGLGIPLTCTILGLMGSKLDIQSTYGVGSTFSFMLRQEVENWEPLGSLDEAIRRAKAETTEEHQYFKAPAARILTVDDIPLNLKVFQSLLARTEIRIDTASGGMEALSLMRKTKYDMVFLDHMMPEMDGLETFERMKSDRFNVNRYDTPVIALTANAVSGARELYMDKGFEDYLTKPINSIKLENLILKYLDPSLVTMIDKEEEQESKEDEVSSEMKDFLSAVRKIPMIEVNVGVDASGGVELYKSVLHDYMETIEPYSARIEGFYNERDLDNYRIQVHALKSTSRMAGASRVSELARELERAADTGNLEFIQENTAELLRLYRELRDPLKAVFGVADEQDDRPEIDPGMFKEGLTAMREAVDSFDYDLIESVMSEFENYRMPNGFDEDYSKLKLLIAEVAGDDIAALLDKCLEKL